ncbi:hypothetical protein HOD88_03775 [archaeon]|jgi:hypothetical protein|nr:hypothetical protein [archaeon]
MKSVFLILISMCLFFSLMNLVSALSVVVNVPEKYTEVVAGERVYFEIEVKFPENPSRIDLILEYDIFNEKGEVIAQSKVLKAIETQASFLDFIVIPENAYSGRYYIQVKVKDYEELSESVGASFQVKGENKDLPIIFFWIFIGLLIIYLGFRFRNVWKKILVRAKIKKIVRERTGKK